MQRDDRVTAYIERAAPFAQPILRHLRELVHAACPQAQETLKWGAPSFVYNKQILCMMAAFKGHAALSFWHGDMVTQAGRESQRNKTGSETMGQFGRLTGIADLPDAAALTALVHDAMALVDAGVPATRKAAPRAPIPMPDDFGAALAAAPAAQAQFHAFPPGKQRDYLEWVTEAKRAETRAARIAQSVTWLAEGKARHWKYER